MHCSLLIGDISVAIYWENFFRHSFLPNDVFCARNNFSSHLATMAISCAIPVYSSYEIARSRPNSIVCFMFINPYHFI